MDFVFQILVCIAADPPGGITVPTTGTAVAIAAFMMAITPIFKEWLADRRDDRDHQENLLRIKLRSDEMRGYIAKVPKNISGVPTPPDWMLREESDDVSECDRESKRTGEGSKPEAD